MVPKMTKSKFVILIIIKMIELSIDIWLLENKYLEVKFFFSIANLIEKSNKFEDSLLQNR